MVGLGPAHGLVLNVRPMRMLVWELDGVLGLVVPEFPVLLVPPVDRVPVVLK